MRRVGWDYINIDSFIVCIMKQKHFSSEVLVVIQTAKYKIWAQPVINSMRRSGVTNDSFFSVCRDLKEASSIALDTPELKPTTNMFLYLLFVDMSFGLQDTKRYVL